MRRRNSPVQQWVDSIPSAARVAIERENITSDGPTPLATPGSTKEHPFLKESYPSMTVSAPVAVPNSPIITTTGIPSRLVRDPSLQSDSSHCSSVESLLELRKADPEAILLGLGFGGCPGSPQDSGPLSRIPKRFLQPSKLKGIAINDFLKHQQETSESFDSASLGYRGLTGSPYVAPSEIVQKIMERLREHESHELDAYAAFSSSAEPFNVPQQDGRLSVLSPDNRQFLERPRSKSPDMRNKRMIIGQKSFAFGCNGDLIEIDASGNGGSRSNCGASVYASHLENPAYSTPRDTGQRPRCEEINDANTIFSKRCQKRLEKQLSFDNDSSLSEVEDDVFPTSAKQLDRSKAQPGSEHREASDLRKITEERTDSEERRESPASISFGRSSKSDTQREYRGEPTDDTGSTGKNIQSPRRASDGSCGDAHKQNKLTQDEGRRFSDGVMKTSLSDRRRSLKRQAKISDADAIEYCGLEFLDPIASLEDEKDGRKRESNEPANLTTHRETENETAESSAAAKTRLLVNTADGRQSPGCAEISPKPADDACSKDVPRAASEGSPRSSEERHRCCRDDSSGQVCRHDESYTGCCCRESCTNCWRKVEKVTKKSRKLESAAAKNRQDMAEIRDMLSNVLSVRMEPGF